MLFKLFKKRKNKHYSEEELFEELQCFKKKYKEARDSKLLLYSFILDRGLSENLRNYAVENDLPNFDEFFEGIKPK